MGKFLDSLNSTFFIHLHYRQHQFHDLSYVKDGRQRLSRSTPGKLFGNVIFSQFAHIFNNIPYEFIPDGSSYSKIYNEYSEVYSNRTRRLKDGCISNASR